MKNFVLKRPKLTVNKTEASYLKNFQLAHINWELNRQEDRLFQQENRIIQSMRKGSRLF
ncbi:MAG: hypothetical protein RI909_1646 [Bacteroidota bacterium]|jgi:hypothetical protein